jgi:5'-nucleotidase
VTAPPKFVVLLTNDDGIAAPGIDVMAQALSGLSGIELVISAPAENQSGTGDKTTDGAVTSSAAKTSSGIEGTAVKGFPADSVKAALDGGLEPDLVVSGINAGQNIGPLASLSGTVGAAKTAARAGYPAVAASQGLGPNPDYPAAAQLVIDWIAENREALLDGTAPVEVVSYNVPSCEPTSALKALVEVPLATDAEGRDLLTSNCASTATDPADDVDAFINGYPSVAEVPFG